MESNGRVKYNPGVLGDDELIRSFVVRQKHLDIILEAVRENADVPSNRHLLVIGPRGIGKTMLVRRVAAEVRANSEYSRVWLPIVYGEESYQVSSSGEFWLEALIHLSDNPGAQSLDRTVDELRGERDDARLRERALARLLDFADASGKRILLVVENLGMLCEDIPADDAWKIRYTLLNERRIMMIGTATSRFGAVTDPGEAWFELFGIQDLKPLDLNETGELWRSVTREKLRSSHVRAIRILTGGNPRLLTVLAGFAAKRSFRELMEQLVHLIDDHTEYFKSHLDALAFKERKVFVALLEQWNPVSAADVARVSRLNVNEVSALLNRLVSRGAVEIFEQRPRRKLYQAAERLYNIYYLMRRRGQPSDRVRAAVSFMVLFYGRKQLASTIAALAKEACSLPAGKTEDHFAAYAELAKRAPQEIWHRALEKTPPEFFNREDAPEFIRRLPKTSEMSSLIARATKAMKSGNWGQAELALRGATDVEDDQTWLWTGLGSVFAIQQKTPEAVSAFRRAVDVDPKNWMAWRDLSRALDDLSQPDEAERAAREAVPLLRLAVDASAPSAALWTDLASVLWRLRRRAEAAEAYGKAAETDPANWRIWWDLARVLVESTSLGEAERAYRMAIDLKPDDACLQHEYGRILGRIDRLEEAQGWCEKAIDAAPDHAPAWTDLGVVLNKRAHFAQAEEKFRHAITLDSQSSGVWENLGSFLADRGRYDEAKNAFQSGVKLDPKNRDLWSIFGHMISRHGSPIEAEEIWMQALEFHPELAGCAVHLLDARSALGVDHRILVGQADEWIERAGRRPAVLSSMARFVVRSKITEALPKAELWANEALSRDTDWDVAETLALVRAAQGKWSDAIQNSRPVLEAATVSKHAQERITQFLIQGASAGFAREALDLLAKSSAAQTLEPLVIGLQIYLGESPQVAKEILEIGGDVADRIREVARIGHEIGSASIH